MVREAITELDNGWKLAITAVPVTETEPPVCVYQVIVEGNGQIWRESPPTLDRLNTFLRGLEAGASMFAKMRWPLINIPREEFNS